MKIYNEIINLETKERLELINITNLIEEIVAKSNIKNGLVQVFSKHTTLAIKINEWEPLLIKDMKNTLEKIAPFDNNYFHDKTELRKDCSPDEPKNADGHLKCLFLECSQTIPIKSGKLDLGKWQNIIAIETSGSRERQIAVQVIGE